MKKLCGIMVVVLSVLASTFIAYTKNNDTVDSTINDVDVELSDSDVVASGASIDVSNSTFNENDLLKEAYLKFDKVKFDSYTYGWEKESLASRPIFTDGVLSGKIKDFDNDNNLELMIVKLLNSDRADENYQEYANVKIEMYEIESNEVKLVADTDAVALINNITDAGGLECFIKNNYIVLECASQNNTFSDGVSQRINIYSYDGKKFVNESEFVFSGSCMRLENDNEYTEKFNRLGFEDTAEYFKQEIVSPYFITIDFETSEWNFNDCINLAKIEKDIDPVAELLITNNNSTLLNEGNNIDDWINYFVENGIMNIELNNYSNME